MIVELTVDNLAIIEHSQIRFEGGFSVLTGETGAGKSLLIDAINLALGERADTELVRTGARSATVSAVFRLGDREDLKSRCADLGIELEDDTLFVQREVMAEGRSQCRINGKLTPLSVLRQIGAHLVDMHGQHDHQSLLDPTRHIESLDQWIGEPVRVAKEKVVSAYELASEARRKLAALQRGLRDREQRLDLLRFQVNEIESINPVAGESVEIEAQLSRLKYSERLSNAAAAAVGALDDQEGCAVDLAGTALKGLEDVIRFDGSLDALTQPLREALIQLQEAAHGLRGYMDNLEVDPALIDDLTTRSDALKRLRRKYGESEEAVLAHLQSARDELELLESAEASEEDLTREVGTLEARLAHACSELTQLRKQYADEFAGLVEGQLGELAMNRAQFRVSHRERLPDAQGADEVEFLFSANAGESLRPLSKIASGGEISRVMLAIKSALAGKAGVPTLIFDEADAGIGGRAAMTVARKLEGLSGNYQVLVISHLPQVAARATHHYRIEKSEVGDRVVTSVRRMQPEERVAEIARMIAGDVLTETALANARELIG